MDRLKAVLTELLAIGGALSSTAVADAGPVLENLAAQAEAVRDVLKGQLRAEQEEAERARRQAERDKRRREAQRDLVGLTALPGAFTLNDIDDDEDDEDDEEEPIATPVADQSIAEPVTLTLVDTAPTEVDDEEDLDNEDDWDEDDEEYEYVPEPAVDLLITIPGAGEATLRAAVEQILPSLEEKVHGYTLQTVTEDSATLSAPDGSGLPIGTPEGTIVVLVPASETIPAYEVIVAGEVNAENPPIDPIEQANARVQEAREMRAAYELDEPEPETVTQLELSRLDEKPLSIEEAEPVAAKAVANLSAFLGTWVIDGIVEVDGVDSRKVVNMHQTAAGALDRDTLAAGLAQFDGVLPFPGLGRVRARAVSR